MAGIRKEINRSVRVFLLLLTLVFFCAAAVTAVKVHAAAAVSYLEYDDKGKATLKTQGTFTEITGSTTELTNGWYVVSQNVTNKNRINVSGENVRVIIEDGCTLTVPAGIRIVTENNNTIFFYGQAEGTGTLIAGKEATGGNAGIGGNTNEQAGTVNVHGVRVEAYGASGYGGGGAGIGGGRSTGNGGGNGGGFYSYAGSTYAKGGNEYDAHGNPTTEGGAGIGGGSGGEGGYNVVYGGDVEAHGGSGASGIGGGYGDDRGQLYIYGGNVKAYGGYGGAGVGSGRLGAGSLYYFYMTGGTLYAQGGTLAAGFGGGEGSGGLNIGYFKGGKITAVAGAETRGGALGMGDPVTGSDNDYNGGLILEQYCLVKAGASESTAALVTSKDISARLNACYNNKYAEIYPCDHPDKVAVDTGSQDTHEWSCDFCGASGTEHHILGEDGKCICGADLSDVWIRDEEGNYLIYTTSHWNMMCDLWYRDITTQGKTFLLMNDITITRGFANGLSIPTSFTSSDSRLFLGHFDGQGHTLNVDLSGNPESTYLGPFNLTHNCTIENLHVTGTINKTGTTGGVGGLIGYNMGGDTTIRNVRVSVDIVCDVPAENCGGFSGYTWSWSGLGQLKLIGCAFDGTIKNGADNNFSGFTGTVRNGYSVLVKDCIFDYPASGKCGTEAHPFVFGGNYTLENSFYTDNLNAHVKSGADRVWPITWNGSNLDVSPGVSATAIYDTASITTYGNYLSFKDQYYGAQGKDITVRIAFKKEEDVGYARVNRWAYDRLTTDEDGTTTFTMPGDPANIDVEELARIMFMDGDDNVFYEQQIHYYRPFSEVIWPEGTPSKTPDAYYIDHYVFDKWIEPDFSPYPANVYNDLKIKSTYTPVYKDFTVSFVRDDGTPIDSAEYTYGTPASEIVFPEDPTKEADEYTSYVFDHWEPAAADVTKDTTYTAVFRPTDSYTVSFYMDDGTLIDQEFYLYGTEASEIAFPEAPEKEPGGHYTYTFDHWDTAEKVTGDASYYAHYTPVRRDHKWNYSVEWSEDHSTVTAKMVCEYDESECFEETIPAKSMEWWSTTSRQCEEKGDMRYYFLMTDFYRYGAFYENYDLPYELRSTFVEGVLEPMGHSWILYSVHWNGDDTATGYLYCSRDSSHKMTETADVESEFITAPTCEEGGTVRLTANFTTVENGTRTDEKDVPALGHDFGLLEEKLDETGHYWYCECSRCDETLRIDITDEDCQHNALTTIPKEDPTCTEDGREEYYQCDYCHQYVVIENGEKITLTEENFDEYMQKLTIPAKGHDYGEWTVTAEATCTTDGSKEKVCSVCGDKVTEVILAKGHAFSDEFTVDKAASCTEEGTKSRHCANCDAVTDVTVIPKTDHTYGDWAVVAEATCTEDGSKEKVCSVCEDKVTEVIPATGHKWNDEYTVDKEASCTEEGSKSKHCSVCNAIDESTVTVIPKVDHTYGEWIVTKEATCTEDGSKEKVCGVCGDKVTETIPALGHDWDEGVVTKEPSFTEEGELLHTCRRNATHTYTEVIPKLDRPDEPIITRVAGSNRYATSIEAANHLKETNGISKFDSIIVASGADFPDALSASYLAYKKNGPILLVNSGTIAMVSDYINSNLASGGTVYIVGGTGAVPEALDQKINGTVKRLAGSNRYATNIEVLKEAGVEGEDLLVASGKGFADALSASAAKKPIFLVGAALTADQKAYLDTNAKTTSGKIYIIGGTGAVSQSIEDAVRSYGSIKRLAGSNRYATSIAVAEELFPETVESVVIANGKNFPDGLSGGPIATGYDAPLILVIDSTCDHAAKYFSEREAFRLLIMGGTGVIADSTAGKITGGTV